MVEFERRQGRFDATGGVLGKYSTRGSIAHTSRSEMGRIYIPEVNAALMIGCRVLVVGSGFSTALGGASGCRWCSKAISPTNKVLQREVILLAVVTDEVPEVEEAERASSSDSYRDLVP